MKWSEIYIIYIEIKSTIKCNWIIDPRKETIVVYELSRALNVQSAMMKYILNWISINPIFNVNKEEYGMTLTPYEELCEGCSPMYIPESRISMNSNHEIDIRCDNEIITLSVVGKFTV